MGNCQCIALCHVLTKTVQKFLLRSLAKAFLVTLNIDYLLALLAGNRLPIWGVALGIYQFSSDGGSRASPFLVPVANLTSLFLSAPASWTSCSKALPYLAPLVPNPRSAWS